MLKLFFKADLNHMIAKGMTFREIQNEMGFENIGQGFGYKSYDAWQISLINDFYKTELIVYIPEYCYNDGNTKQISLDCCYTREDFENLCKNTSVNKDFLFDACDWQHPSSLLNEIGDWIDDDIDITKDFKNFIYITEPNINGEFSNMDSYEYLLESSHKITNEELMDILFQACEIERMYSGEIHVKIQTELNGEYYDSDECIFKINIKLDDKKLSDFIKWDMCPNLPPIYKVDRVNSTIECIENI